MERQFVDALHFTDYAMADYKNPQGRSVNFYTAYYESQRKGEATHSPETCLPGSGWLFREAGTTSVPPGPKGRYLSSALSWRRAGRKLTYYWFAMRGRTLTNLYQVKLYTFWDALTRHRTDGALVRLITPVSKREVRRGGGKAARIHERNCADFERVYSGMSEAILDFGFLILDYRRMKNRILDS